MCGAGLQTGPDLNCLVIVLAAPLHIPISKPASLSILCPKSPLPQIGPRPPSPWSSPRQATSCSHLNCGGLSAPPSPADSLFFHTQPERPC